MKTKLLKWIGVLAMLLVVLPNAAPAADIGIVFSEVLYDSADAGDDLGEWLEIYNSTSADVNIGGWTIWDNTEHFTIPACTTIGAGGYLIIAEDRTYFYNKYGFYPHLANSPLRFHNDGDYVILKDKQGNIKDQAAWETGGNFIPGWGSSTLPSANTDKSIVRSNLNVDTDTYADWLSNQTPDPSSNTLPPGIPTISLHPTNLNFSVTSGGSTSAKTFVITNSGCGSLNWTAGDNVGWLSCSPASGTGAGTVTVSVDAGGLTPGSYTDVITISDANASNSPQTVAVTLTVSAAAAPVITLNPAELSFNVACNGAAQTKTFSIGNSGGGNLDWSVSDNVSWLSCSPASGTGAGVVTVTVDPTGLNTGDYEATITVSDPNAANSPQTVSVSMSVSGECKPKIQLNRTDFSFGAVGETLTCIPQAFLVDNNGAGTLDWTVTCNVDWLDFTPAAGIGAGQVTLLLNDVSKGMPVGTYTGTVTVSDANAVNSPQTVSVTLVVHASDGLPFGEFATPTDGAEVYSSIPVTGWALDDVGIERVTIYRHDVNAENGLAYVGDAVFVEGARPDVATAYPRYPLNYKAGWGYMMLTNALPPDGNGTYVLEVIMKDCGGHEVSLGTKTITVDNISAVKPFGAIDTPIQGGNASGQGYRNHGWAITPIPNKLPEDGSTIDVYVDGVKLGNVTYGIPRTDVHKLFPGYLNSAGPGGYFDFDTKPYPNGVHTIHWIAEDDAGNADGIGSRYFNILNFGVYDRGTRPGNPVTVNMNGGPDRPCTIQVKKGCGRGAALQTFYPDNDGFINIEIKELERLEIHFSTQTSNISTLPIGSTLDREKGIFYWQPGPGFLGQYKFDFFLIDQSQRRQIRTLKIKIVPLY